MDVDSDMAVSVNEGSLKGFSRSFKGVWGWQVLS